MRKFVLEADKKEDGTLRYNGWWEIEGTYAVNRCGGRHHFEKGKYDKVVEAEDWDHLDYSYLIKPDSEFGWISPNGDWYGCNYRDHVPVAEFYLKKSERELEKSGWVKVYFDSWGRERHWFSDKDIITDKQKITLSRLGFSDAEISLEL